MCLVSYFFAPECSFGRTMYLDSVFLAGLGEGGCIVYLDSYFLYSVEEGLSIKFGSYLDASGVGVLTVYG